MKVLIVIASIFTCFSSYAGILTQEEIVEAVKESLNKSPLTCVSKGEVNTTASSNKLNWRVLTKDLEVKINENNPTVLVFRGKNKFYDSNIEITTTDNYMQVVKIEASIFLLGSIERRNVGTIVNPIFENVYIQGKLYQKVLCD